MLFCHLKNYKGSVKGQLDSGYHFSHILQNANKNVLVTLKGQIKKPTLDNAPGPRIMLFLGLGKIRIK